MTFTQVSPAEFFFTSYWDPMEKHFGALSFIAGSLFVTLTAIVIGAPLGILGAVFMAKVVHRRGRARSCGRRRICMWRFPLLFTVISA